MFDFSKARQNMIDCQLKTNNILDEKLIDVFSRVPREEFLPENRKMQAYLDEDFKLDNCGFFLEPLIHARLLQAADLDENDVVLNVGDYTGYTSAVLSSLVQTVITPEMQKHSLKDAQNIWDAEGITNIVVTEYNKDFVYKDCAPYDKIILHGAVTEVPDAYFSQLSENGILCAVVRETPQDFGALHVYKKASQNDIVSSCVLSNCATYFLDYCEPQDRFQF